MTAVAVSSRRRDWALRSPKQRLRWHLQLVHRRYAPDRYTLERVRAWHENWHAAHGQSHVEA